MASKATGGNGQASARSGEQRVVECDDSQSGAALSVGGPEAPEELAALTGGLAHEIRNPLSTLKVNLQLLAEDWRELARSDEVPGEPVRRSLSRLQTTIREVDRLAGILDRFLRYMARHEMHREPYDLNQFISELADLYAAQAQAQSVRLRVRPAERPLFASIDVNLLKQAAVNLVLNALHAMPEGGELTLTARSADGGQAAIEVCDTGVGIPPDRLSKIFQIYFSTRSGGTGLGLPTARRIVTAHGGRIDVKSEPARGSTFTIVLSALPAAERE